jgi:hypothetical protein
MVEFMLFMWGGLVVAGLTMIVTAFGAVPREPIGLPAAQLVIDGKHDLGASRSRIRVRKNRLIGGILMIVLATLALLAGVSFVTLATLRD